MLIKAFTMSVLVLEPYDSVTVSIHLNQDLQLLLILSPVLFLLWHFKMSTLTT